MPHKVTTAALLDEASLAVKIAGSCNAILRRDDGSLYGDMFDGDRVHPRRQAQGLRLCRRGLSDGRRRRGRLGDRRRDRRERPGSIALFDIREAMGQGSPPGCGGISGLRSARRQRPGRIRLVVNATPLGMSAGDPLPFAPDRIDPGALVGDVVLGAGNDKVAPGGGAARLPHLVGTDMLFEQIPAYLEFFGYGSATRTNSAQSPIRIKTSL